MIKFAYDAYAAVFNKEWVLDRGHTIGASSVGACARKTWFEKNADDPEAAKPDPEYTDRYGAKVRGTVIEDHWWVPALRHVHGDNLLYAGESQKTMVLDLLSATPDGLLINQPRDCLKHLGIEDIGCSELVVECKSLDDRFNSENLPKFENVFQGHVQAGLFHALTKHRPQWILISYTSAGWWDTTYEFPIRFDPAVLETAKLRARDIMLAQSAQALKPEGFIAGGKDCDYCAFTRACGSARAAYVPRDEKPLDPATTDKIANQAKLVSALEASSEDAAAAAREAKSILRDMLSEAGTRRVEGEGVKVRWSSTKGRAGFNNAALREAAGAAGIDLKQFETRGAEGDQLVITEVRK
jgi:hypothetical protein